jgi:nitrogen-specific signal transduction histidine kinase/ligand-binding sensor protein
MKNYTLSELIDLSNIQKLAEAHYEISGMPIGIIDAIDGSVLVGVGWQDICTRFHRANPSSLKACQESDDYIKSHLVEGEACHYRCKHGLWDIGVPIMVAKRHLATLFLGQFFYEGETADRDYFVRQAQQYGYDPSGYLAALDRVPVFTKEKVDSIITYNKSFSKFIAELAEHSQQHIESAAKYQAVVESFDGFIYICSSDYRVEFMNDKFINWIGKEPVGEFCYEILHERDSICPWCVNDRVFAGETVRWEVQSPKDERWYYVVNVPIYNADGSMSKQSMIMDITERKRMETELQNKNYELERFAYTVSHDLKSPLITIRGFAGAICADLAAGRDDRVDKDLQRICDASDKMMSLLDNLLQLSRIGRVINPPEPVDMTCLVNEVVGNLTTILQEGNAQVFVQFDLPTVSCDRQRILEVLQNLIENAVQYRGEQSGLQIRIGLREEDGRQVFFVQDNGVGIAPKYHQHIFGLFNRLQTQIPGNGIGLALVKRIIEEHGGSVWVESEGEGAGSTFCFSLD